MNSINSAVKTPVSSAMNAVKSLFGIRDGIVQGGRIITTDPSDYLIATKNPRSLGNNQPVTINITVDSPTVRSDSDIKELVRQIERSQQVSMRRYTSYT